MRRNIKKVIIIVFIITINFILNVSFSQGQGGGLLGHGPTSAGGGNGGGPLGHGGMSLGNDTIIYSTDIENVISTAGLDTNPIEVGAYTIVNGPAGGIDGIVGTNDEITEYDDALEKILHVIQNVINYALGILSLIALIYLIIHGFIILTAAGDDSKVKKGFKGIKNAFIAIAGIGLSWIIVSFILWLINTFVG